MKDLEALVFLTDFVLDSINMLTHENGKQKANLLVYKVTLFLSFLPYEFVELLFSYMDFITCSNQNYVS